MTEGSDGGSHATEVRIHVTTVRNDHEVLDWSVVEVGRRHAAETGGVTITMPGVREASSPVHQTGLKPVSQVENITFVTGPGVTLQEYHLDTGLLVN